MLNFSLPKSSEIQLNVYDVTGRLVATPVSGKYQAGVYSTCLLYTSDAADERSSVDLGGRRIIKKKKTQKTNSSRWDNKPKEYNHNTRLHRNMTHHVSETEIDVT